MDLPDPKLFEIMADFRGGDFNCFEIVPGNDAFARMLFVKYIFGHATFGVYGNPADGLRAVGVGVAFVKFALLGLDKLELERNNAVVDGDKAQKDLAGLKSFADGQGKQALQVVGAGYVAIVLPLIPKLNDTVAKSAIIMPGQDIDARADDIAGYGFVGAVHIGKIAGQIAALAAKLR